MAVILGDGTVTFGNGTQMVAASLGEGVLPSLSARAVNTAYYNSSSRLLFVCVNCSSTAGTSGFLVNGVEVARISNSSRWQISFIVPPWSSYIYSATGGTNTIYRWTECN